jgi:hypothetical protein
MAKALGASYGLIQRASIDFTDLTSALSTSNCDVASRPTFRQSTRWYSISLADPRGHRFRLWERRGTAVHVTNQLMCCRPDLQPTKISHNKTRAVESASLIADSSHHRTTLPSISTCSIAPRWRASIPGRILATSPTTTTLTRSGRTYLRATRWTSEAVTFMILGM